MWHLLLVSGPPGLMGRPIYYPAILPALVQIVNNLGVLNIISSRATARRVSY